MSAADHKTEVAQFIKEHRGDAAHFENLLAALNKEMETAAGDEAYKTQLLAVKEKAGAYSKMKEAAGDAWPEFEKFVTGFERAVLHTTPAAGAE